ncbi:MAG: Cytochrome bd-I ubiquinol oxidase subunit 1 [Calditrichaeota bacterium]|nr:Cytochrome bd-I ubiquinol oxidase subunit 1 [Calditrichota bacterium]
MDAEILARVQFAFTIGFHYIYPPISIGLGIVLVVMEGIYLKTRDPLYLQLTKFWTKIFGLVFAIGVATGIVMEFQFGTNWSNYSRYVGDVFGSALAAEGVFAFFLESGFLAIVLFGWEKVKPGWHWFSTWMVMLGSHFSAIWIVVANSWMQTPAGYHIVETPTGPRAEITDFWAVVFNPSTVDRLSHVFMGAWQAGAWFVLSVSAYYVLKRRHVDFARASMRIAFVLAVVASLGQLVTGHDSGVKIAETQPAKLAAFEGVFAEQQPGADLTIAGWVDEERGETRSFAIPGMLSWLVHGDVNEPITGLNAFPRDEWPPVNLSFQLYHIMIAIGVLLIVFALLGGILAWMRRLSRQRWLLWIIVFAVLLPQIANQVGWAAAEVGRQPWIVYGLMKTADGLSPTVSGGAVLASLILFTLIYLGLFVMFIALLDRKIRRGPGDIEQFVRAGRRA